MSKNNRVLIVDKMHKSIVPLLEKIGFHVSYDPQISRVDILRKLEVFVGLIVRSKTLIDRELVDAGHQLKFVARAGAGMDLLDTNYLQSKNIHILNAPEGNRDAVGEHALGLLLNLLHKISAANAEVRGGLWRREENRGMELKDKIVGIYGFGNAGSSFARKLSGFDCEILAYDKFKSDFSTEGVREVSETEFRKKVEILSLHVPLTEETQALFSLDELQKYPNLKIVINTARGEILKLKDVMDLMDEGRLIGLGLDVLENERIGSFTASEESIFKKLSSHRNVILTPHVAGWTIESYKRINQVLVNKIRALNLLQ